MATLSMPGPSDLHYARSLVHHSNVLLGGAPKPHDLEKDAESISLADAFLSGSATREERQRVAGLGHECVHSRFNL